MMMSRQRQRQLKKQILLRLACTLLVALVFVNFLVSDGCCRSGCVMAIPTPNSSAREGIVLRIRLADGSMERVQIEEGKEDSLTLDDILRPFDVPNDASIQVSGAHANTKDSIANLKHGSMITVVPPSKPSTIEKQESRFAKLRSKKSTEGGEGDWNPYPDLAKDYDSLLLKTKSKRFSGGKMSYSDISKLQSALHVVEPQKDGPLKRVYMCRVSAERFYSNGVTKAKGKKKGSSGASTGTAQCRVGLLLGTIQTERVDKRPKKARTSLSSQTSDSDYCTVAKVQAVWEPPNQQKEAASPDKLYDTMLARDMLRKNPRVLRIAQYLGLVPIGWEIGRAHV